METEAKFCFPGRIVLTGPKHAGKSRTAAALACLYHADCFDLDELISAQTGKSPRALYREGPGVFREAETLALEALLKSGKRGVIAAGGGIIDNGPAAALLEKAEGLVIIYLDVSADTAWQRIAAQAARDGGLPPFLNTPRPRETHRDLHERRAAAYRNLARLTIWAEGKSPEEIAREISRALADSG
ncbi:MAG: shikimate kinase, partial [Treponema sp.]|nr:shikimate kinase [Treponema sp.]